jgi:hypothetical protein
MKKVVLLLVVGVFFAQAALASEYAAFTSDLVKPYGFFKQSLSLTSKKEDAEKAKTAVASFIEAWGTFSAKYSADVPKPFAKIQDFSSRIKRPVEVGKQAAEFLKDGNVKQAHMVLEEVRYLMWDMRVKSAIVSLSDKANDFHEAMEVVLDHADAAKEPADAKQVFDRYGAWLQIKWEDMLNAPDTESVKKAFDPAFEDGRKAVAAYLASLKQGDAAQAKKLSGGVKGAYKKIWMLDNR